MSLWDAITNAITDVTEEPFSIDKRTSISGGCINSAYQLKSSSGESYFVKLNSASKLDMFEAEAEGLNEINNSQSIRAPKVIGYGDADGQAYLILEYLALGSGNSSSMSQLGRDLAKMHRYTRNRFGWHRDNTIGSTPQHNNESSDWISFWREQRLGFQLELASHNGYGRSLTSKGDALMDNLEYFFDRYSPEASLLHGDLWSGNYAIADGDTPVIFDPAVYFGDREADIAMTELFGGFSPDFYRAYKEAYPLAGGFEERKTLYNLYHILNHVNLFGSGYLGQAESMLDQLLRRCR